jgi:alanine-synthesizing transaminase
MQPATSMRVAPARRVSGFTYAIRNIVTEAQKLEAQGRQVRYLNIGDPIAFGFQTPPHLIDAVERALRDNRNGYTASAGITPAREAVAREYARRGMPMTPDRVVVTAGTSEGIELTLAALVNPGEDVLVPAPTYPLYTAVLAKIGARAVFYRTDPDRGWGPDLQQLPNLVTPATRAIVVIDPNNPTGAVYSDDVRRALLEFSDRHGLVLLADEVYGDLTYEGAAAPIGSLDPSAPVISYSSLSKAYLAPGWRTGWLAVGGGSRLDDLLAAIRKLADGRLCSSGPMQYAIEAALDGDRSHQEQLREALRARAAITIERLCAIPGITCTPPRSAFYAMPRVALPPGRTDEDYVLGLLRATGVLCVYGSGFGADPGDGYFRVVFLAPPEQLSAIYDDVAAFTREFLAR